jgi:DNA-binding response OmpR family regulator
MRRAEGSGRGPEAAGGRLTFGELSVDPNRHEARVRDVSLDLTPTEFRLLETLLRADGAVVPHLRLARAGWPADVDPDLLWLKPHLARLRAKLDAHHGPSIVAVRGVGYRLEAGG